MDKRSEVARLREQIDLEIEALQRLKDFAIVATHEAIMKRYRKLDQYHASLAEHIGEDAATAIICEEHNKIQ